MTEEVEHLSGREVVRDPVSGRFQKVKLDPQTARDMGQASRSSTSSASKLLGEQGYNQTDNPAPEYIVVMAKQAIRHTAAMSHWRRVHALTSDTSETGGLERPRHNEKCALCGHYNLYSHDGRVFADLARLLREHDAAGAG